MPRVAAIIPAFNEERTIGDVVGAIKRCVLVHDVIPVLTGAAEVCIGQIKRDFIQALFPSFSGQRALHRRVLDGIPDLENTGFGIEAALSRHVKTSGLPTCTVPLRRLAHVSKQEKHGLVRGYVAKLKATWQIAKWSGRTGRA